MKSIKYIFPILVLLASLVSCKQDSTPLLKIYPDNVISENYIGNGVQWSAYPHAATVNDDWGKLMTDEKWDMNFKRLDYMQPKLFRVVDQANWRYLIDFDNEGNPILNFENPQVEAVEKILKYAQDNDITVLFGEWGTPFKMHDTDAGHSDKYTGANDPKWINGIVEYLDYLIIQKGYTCIKYYNLVNEPNGDWASTMGDFNEWKEGAVMLSEALKVKGLDKFVAIAGPDAVTRYDNPNSTYTGAGWVEQTAKQIDEHIGIYEVHDYTEYELVRSGGFKDYHKNIAELMKHTGKQIIFGELGFSRNGQANQKRANDDPYACEDSQMDVYDYSYGIDMADASIQSMNAGYSGSAAWALDDAMHTCGDLGNKEELKRWGMWNSLGTELCNNPADENIRPWFYSWSLMCRYFPVGSKIVQTDSLGIEGVRMTTGISGNDMTIAIVNNSKSDQMIDLGISNDKVFKQFLYQEGNCKKDEFGFPVSVDKLKVKRNKLHVEVPANSFVLLTTLEY
jgi:hypothetical protein